MIRRVVAALAALAVGAVVAGPVGEVLFYGLEGFPVDADAKGALRILSATGAVVLLALGAAAAFRIRGRARGWPTVAGALLVSGLLTAYAPLDVDSALGELHPLIRLLAALAGGVALGAALVAVLPDGGDPWPVAAFAAGLVAGIPWATRFGLEVPELRRLTWVDVVALGLAVLAAVAARASAQNEGPGLAAVARVAVPGAIVGAAFHMEYVGRAVTGSPAVVILVVLLLTVFVWVALTWGLLRWSGTLAGSHAARFALTCAGATAALYVSSGRNAGLAWLGGWLPVLAVAAAAAGALLARRRPAIPWDAAGVGGAALVALVVGAVPTGNVDYSVVGAPVAAFALGAALGRTGAAGALCGLVTLLLTVPVMFGTITPLQGLLVDQPDVQPGTVRMALLFAPVWLTGLVTAVLLARRPDSTAPVPQPLAAG